MSYTSTPNYALKKPNVNSDNDVWGDHWNQNADALDTIVHGIDTRAAVTSFNTRTGAVTLQASDVTSLGFATTTANDGSYVNVSGDTMAGPLTLSGNAVSGLQAVPLQQLNAAVPAAGNVTPAMDSVGAPGVSALYSRQDHVHPTDTSRYAASNPAGYQTAAQVTTALAPYAPINSPAFTGVPTTAATPAPGDNTTKLATTAFVSNAIGSIGTGVSSFNTRTGAVVLSSTDVQTAIGFAPAPLNAPVFTGDARAVTPAAGDNDTSIATTAFVQSIAATVYTNVGRNLLHNAALFNVAQRGTGPWTTGTYSLDRWFIAQTTDTINFGRFNLADSDRAAIGDEAATYTFTNNWTGNAAAGAYNALTQCIENVRRLAGKTVTVSFWAVANSALRLGVSLDQSMGTGGSPSAGTTGTGQSVLLSTSWARYSLTFTVPSLSGKTLGTNGDDYTRLLIWYSSGATNATRAGIGVQSGIVNLWGVQLEVGAQATPLEKVDPGDDLRRCQRFYQTGAYNIQTPYSGNAGNMKYNKAFPVTMRAVPTVTATGTGAGVNNTASGAEPSTDSVAIIITCTSTGGSSYWNGAYTASADL